MTSKFSGSAICLLLALHTTCTEPVLVPWDHGVIPYYYSGNFSEADRAVVAKAMGIWESVCRVSFREVSPRSNAYKIIRTSRSNTWASSIGENNVENHMYYGDGADSLGHSLHELGHCLGLLHEHQRPDRDLYVQILWSNIYPEYRSNFQKRNNPLIDEKKFAYDYSSIMHYHSRGFSIDGSETIVPLTTEGVTIGQRDELSENDAEKARSIYGPPL